VRGIVVLGAAAVLALVGGRGAALRGAPAPLWSERVDGLRFGVGMPRTLIEGEFFEFSLHLDFVAGREDEEYDLVRHPLHELVTFEFRAPDGTIDIVRPSWPGLPHAFRDADRLPPDPKGPGLPPRTSEVLLFKNRYEFLEPGSYQVTPIYNNRGWSDAYRSPLAQPNFVWVGSIRGPTIPVTILEGRPKPKLCEYFDRLQVECRDGEWVWRMDPKSRRTRLVNVPPGHFPRFGWTVTRNGASQEAGTSGRPTGNNFDLFKRIGVPGREVPCETSPPETLQVEQVWFSVPYWAGRIIRPPPANDPAVLIHVARTAIVPVRR
jgi:hypothetical protein